jgi:hypothetical protein
MESSQKMLNSLKGFSDFSVGAGNTRRGDLLKKKKRRIQTLMFKINKAPAHKQQALSPNAQRLHNAKTHAARESRERRATAHANAFDDISQSLQKLRVDARKAIASVPTRGKENIDDVIDMLSTRFNKTVGLKKQYKRNSAQIKQNSIKSNKNSIKKSVKSVKMELEPTKRNPARTRKNPDRLKSSQLVKPARTRKTAKKSSPSSPQRRNSV